MRPSWILIVVFVIFQSAAAPTSAQNVSDHVELKVSATCEGKIGKIDITLAPLGETKFPGPPGIAILQSRDTGVDWQTPLPFYIESQDEYFPEPPVLQLSYLAGPQPMPELIADFAYCPTVEECLFATERIKVQIPCR